MFGIAPIVTLVPSVSKVRLKVSWSCSRSKSAVALRVKLMKACGGVTVFAKVNDKSSNVKSPPMKI